MHVVTHGTIFDATTAPPHTRFCTFTSLNCAADGTLIAAFRMGSAKDSADEDVRIMVSEDGGAHWQMRWAGFGDVPPGSHARVRSIGLTMLPTGRWLAAIVTVDHSDPALPLANPATQGLLPTSIYVTSSEDRGRHWSTPTPVDLAPHQGNVITGDLLQLQDGTLALQYEAWKQYHDTSPGEHHAALRFSTDGGQRWPTAAIVAHDAANRLLFWDQRLTVAPDDGRLFGLFWTHDRVAQADVPIHSAWSTPDGCGWSTPRSLDIDGQIAAPLALGNGRIFAAYVHRHDPPSLRAILSNDFGATWDAAQELVFYTKQRGGREAGMGGPRDFADYWADMSIWTFGHPALARLPNGDVMVAYYAGDAHALSVHWVQIALD